MNAAPAYCNYVKPLAFTQEVVYPGTGALHQIRCIAFPIRLTGADCPEHIEILQGLDEGQMTPSKTAQNQ